MKKVFHEVVAGLSTFFTMSYVLILCPDILSAGGMDFGAAMTATVITLSCSTILLSLLSGYPMIVGPGLGIAAFLMFSIVGGQGATIGQVLGLVFWAGLIELLLTLSGARQKIMLHIPPTLKMAAPAGIGLFFIALGLKQLKLIEISEGLYSWGSIGTAGQTIGLLGLFLLFFLHRRNHRAAFLFPILFCWGLSLYFGISQLDNLFSLPPPPQLFELDFSTILEPRFWTMLLSVLLIAFFDAGAALTALLSSLGWLRGDGSMPKAKRALISDGAGSIIASLLGTSSCTFYAESSSGIRAGGRTWIVGITAVCCSLLSLFFYPALASIPHFATAPALIGLGTLMASQNEWKAWRDLTEWLPFVITAIAMPLFFNIYLGVALGFVSYAIIKFVSGKRKEIHPLVWGLAATFSFHLLWTYGIFNNLK